MLDDLRTDDAPLTAGDVGQLEDAQQVIHFFDRLGHGQKMVEMVGHTDDAIGVRRTTPYLSGEKVIDALSRTGTIRLRDGRGGPNEPPAMNLQRRLARAPFTTRWTTFVVQLIDRRC